MNNELYISSSETGDRIALIENKRLVEYHEEKSGNQFNVGDIYLGTVKKLVPGLNAAFIDIGYEKDAFLHYLDLGSQVKSLNKFVKLIRNGALENQVRLNGFKSEADIDKLGKINSIFTRNQQILVQVVKEPISTKGPRLSCQLSLAGRYIVLVPFSTTISISKKIADREERQRLKRLMTSIKPENFGVIIRTVAENKEVAELDKDLKSLLKKWDIGQKNLPTAKPRDLLIGEENRASTILRDLLNASFDSIVVDNKDIFEETRTYLKQIAPDKEKILKLYNGKVKLYEHYGIEKQIRGSFGRTVTLLNGGYIIIEHTEALHVVDVNSGNKSNDEDNQEDTALKVNIDAAKEIARQLRLRDLGGILVIDFIDMRKVEHRNLVFEKMREEMVLDRAKYTILPISKFGLMQITRQRVRPVLEMDVAETCPTCSGTGKVTSTLNIVDQIEFQLDHLLTKQNESKILINLHPFLYLYYTSGFISKRMHWLFKYKKWVELMQDSSLSFTEYQFINKQGEEIEMV